MKAPYLPPEHPWYFLHRFGAPNVKWCEDSVMSWVTEPANTWSNIAFFIVAALIWRQGRECKSPLLRFFPMATLILGAASGIYHASSTFILQIFDFLGMFLVFLIPIVINFQRLKWLSPGPAVKLYTAGVVVMTASVPVCAFSGLPVQMLMGVKALGIMGTELFIKLKIKETTNYRPLLIGLFFLVLAAIATVSDVTRTFCDPSNHWLQGHALWHFLSATVIYFCFQFYRINEEKWNLPTK